MTTVTLTANTSQVTTALNQVNAGIQQITTNQQSFAQNAMEVGKSVVSNYMNISAILKDVTEYIDKAYKNQAKYNALINSANYKKYSDQLNDIAKNTQNMNNVYSDSDTLQKLFNSNVDLSSGKLEQLTKISASYAAAMGIDGSEALKRFSEAIAESSTGKLEDLGLYIDSKQAITSYAISLGIAADELDKTQEKQAILNAILAKGKVESQASVNPLSQVRNEYGLMKQNIEGITVATVDWMATGFNTWLASNRYYGGLLGETLYDMLHYFDTIPETLEGDVIPATKSLTDAYVQMNKVMLDTLKINESLGISGITTFRGLSANNIKAIEDLQKKYDKQAAEWAKQHEIRLAIGRKRLEDDYKAQQELAVKQMKFNESLHETELVIDDDFFTQQNENAFIYSKMEEIRRKNELDSMQKASDLKIKEREKQLKEEQKIEMKAQEYVIEASNFAYQNLIAGKTNFLKEMIALSMQKAGAEIFNDGLQGMWQGGRWALSPYPTMAAQGVTMMGYSALEMGAGIALGYAGSKLMPSTGGSSESKNKETAAQDRKANQSNNTQKMDMYMYPDEKAWLRALNKGTNKLKSRGK